MEKPDWKALEVAFMRWEGTLKSFAETKGLDYRKLRAKGRDWSYNRARANWLKVRLASLVAMICTFANFGVRTQHRQDGR